jgi:O-antigen ligase
MAAVADVFVAILVILLLRPDCTSWRPLWAVLCPIVAALAWAGLPLALRGPATIDATIGWANLGGAFACLFAGLAIGARAGLTRRFIDIFIVCGLGYTLFSLVLRQHDANHVWGYGKGLAELRFTGTFLNPNAAACAFSVIAVLATGRLQLAVRQSASHGWSLPIVSVTMVSGLAAALSLSACALTGSRAGLASGVIAIVLLLVLPIGRRLRSGARRQPVLLLASAALIGAGVLAFANAPAAERLGTISADASDRWMALTHHLALANRAPWFGYGMGSFQAINTAHLTRETVDVLWNFGAAHNIIAQTALEAGWPFPLLMILAVLAGLRIVVRTRGLEEADPLMLAQALAVMVVFACASVDIALSVPALRATAAILAGTVLGRAVRASGGERALR